MKKIIFVLAIFGPRIYFAVLSILGLSYEGVESGNNSYWGYLVSLLLFSVLFYIQQKFKEKKISKKEFLIIYLLNAFIIYVISYNTFNSIPLPSQQVILFIIFIIPPFISGYYFSYEKSRLDGLSQMLEVAMIVFTIGLVVSTFSTLISGQSFESFGGSTYQEASYLAAFSFGINLFYLIWGNKVARYDIFKKNIFKIFQVIMLVIQLFSLIVGGGRGAFVLLIVYLFTYTVVLLRQGNYKMIIKYVVIFSVFVLFVIIFTNTFLNNTQILSSGINRILAFISPEGINWEGTSGRDVVYKSVLNIFKENPILGVGFFNYPQPHNLFLEVLVSVGVVGFTIILFLITCILIKFSKVISKDFKNIVILVIFLYPMTMLMFSGSIFTSSEFSFVISYIYFSRLNGTKNIVNSSIDVNGSISN